MRWALAGVLAGGIAGCTWIIGDIPVPDVVTVDAEAIAGAWYVYGLSDEQAVSDRVLIAGDGQITYGDVITAAETESDGLWHLDLGPTLGRVSGRFDARAGIGLMVERDPDDAATFLILVREPALRGTLLGGRTVQLGLTDAGSPMAEFARLQRSQDEVYRQTERLTLTDEQLDARQVTVVTEGDGEPRWVVRLDVGDWLLSPLPSGDGAIGVQRSENGSPLGPVVLWRDPATPALPDRELFCAGLTIEDGRATSRMRSARIQNDRVSWSDGRRGAPRTVEGAAVLTGDGSFYDDQSTMMLPDTQGRLFALLPLVPQPDGALPERSWGIALCLGVDAEGEPLEMGIDAGPADEGVLDAGPIVDGAVDRGPSDAAPLDLDAGTADASAPDAGAPSPDAGPTPDAASTPDGTP